MAEDVWTMSGKGIDARHEIHVSGSWSPAKAPTRFVIPAGSALI
jgi:hypothetical protein